MKKASTFALTLLILLTGTTPAQSTPDNSLAARPPAPVAVPDPQQVVHTENSEMQGLAEWALGRYRQAGLELPNLDLYFHNNNKPCKGYSALHNRTETGSLINVCSTNRTRKLENTLLHELGHAWAAYNLTDDQRRAFVEHQGLTTWYDTDTDWNERGTEHAAEVVAWGVGEKQWQPRWMPNNDLDSLAAAFQQLTGTNPTTNTSPEWQPGDPVS